MKRDLKSNVDVAPSIAAAARVNGTATGTGVDLQGYDSAMLTFESGAWTDGTHTPSIEHSDDNTTYVATAAADLQGTPTAISGTAGQNAVARVGYVGSKRYVRAKLITTGATTGMLSAMNVIRGRARVSPLA